MLNFEAKEDIVEIRIDPNIFPKEVVMRSAYKYIDRAWITVERDKDSGKVLVTVLPREKEERSEDRLEDLALKFNTDLITTFVEDKEAERYAEARNSMIKAAMLSQSND